MTESCSSTERCRISPYSGLVDELTVRFNADGAVELKSLDEFIRDTFSELAFFRSTQILKLTFFSKIP